MQVEQGQHLGDLRGLAAPRRQDRRGEPAALARRRVHAPVVHPRGLDLDRTGGGGDLPGLVVAVADDQAAAALVAFLGQLGDIGVDFGLKGCGEHAPGALADDVVDQGAVSHGGVVIHYGEHGRAFPTGARNAGLLGDHHRINREGTPSARPPGLLHRS